MRASVILPHARPPYRLLARHATQDRLTGCLRYTFTLSSAAERNRQSLFRVTTATKGTHAIQRGAFGQAYLRTLVLRHYSNVVGVKVLIARGSSRAYVSATAASKGIRARTYVAATGYAVINVLRAGTP